MGLKTRLLQERDDTWHLPSMSEVRTIQLQRDNVRDAIKVQQPTRVQDLVLAEKQLVGPGYNVAGHLGQAQAC